MSCLTTVAAALVAAAAPNPIQSLFPPRPLAAPATPAAQGAEISVLTYNVRGLPWPLASGRGQALKAIGEELAAMRREGRQPDVVVLQEGFRAEVADLVRASGYRYWAKGPGRAERASGPPPANAEDFASSRYPLSGEGWGKFTNGGLHVLSDLPIVEAQALAYRHCAGFDCLANKGAMLVKLSAPGLPTPLTLINTHLNSKGASGVPQARSLRAHSLQLAELDSFLRRQRLDGAPVVMAGDFNVKKAPARYAHVARMDAYAVVSEFCGAPQRSCGGAHRPGEAPPWLRSQDLQAFSKDGAVRVEPIKTDVLFPKAGRGLSDHDGYLVRYRLAWTPETAVAPRAIEVKPQFGAWGLKVAWRPGAAD